MKVLDAQFVVSVVSARALPSDGCAHVALVGRSNVGKSSLINALARTKIARTSALPGKTRLVNLFRITPAAGKPVDLVDLPGYGYAGPAPNDFEALVTEYWAVRQAARERTLCLFAVDGRHPRLDADREAWAWIEAQGLDAAVVITKIDKLTRSERAQYMRLFEDTFNTAPVAVSATKREGLEPLWQLILKRLLP